MEFRDEMKDKSIDQSANPSKSARDCVAPRGACDVADGCGVYGRESFGLLFDESPLGVAVVNPDHRIVAVNPGLCSMLQFTEDELTKISLFGIIHPDDVEKDIELSRRMFEEEAPFYATELRYVRKNGEPFWVNLTTSPIRDSQGRPVYGLQMIEDITQRKLAEEEQRQTCDRLRERNEEGTLSLREANEGLVRKIAEVKQAEKALLESHERLLSIVETANDPIVGSDSIGNIISWNSAATRTFGYEAEEVMNQPVTLLMPERFRALHGRALERAVAAGRLYYHKSVREVYGRKKDGAEFPVEVSISSWKTQQGMFFTAFIRDITERKQKDEALRKANEELELRVEERTAELVALTENLKQEINERKRIEEMLRDSERLYHTLVEEVPDVIFILDKDGVFTYLNPQAQEFLRRPLREILGTPLQTYVVPEEWEKIQSILALREDSIWDEEIRLLDADGERIFTRIRCKALGDDAHGNVYYEGVMRDITRRRRLEEQLRESRQQLLEKIKIIDELYTHIVESGKARAIAEHTAEVAHELRQPLTIIGGFARRIERQLDSCNFKSVTGQAEAVHIIASEIRRLEKILDALIDFTRRESVTPEPANPNYIVEKVLNVYQEVLGEKNLKLDVILREEVGEIFLDQDRFEQVVRNLVSNAIDASPPGETISIETRISTPGGKALETAEMESETYFEMKVRNHGPVIKEEDLQRLFSPFFTTKNYGTGIGLTVSKKIVEAHKGSISVHSDAGGTTFTVWLPLSHQESAAKTVAQ